ncbi:hypothetical protein [Microvirga alba]|uniref:hypothetical protein n=1 Tax=Microvirga alba TaxID=2791025 RepID=UPI001E3C34E2|nr:hypothetical protein [Microvirga alba]
MKEKHAELHGEIERLTSNQEISRQIVLTRRLMVLARQDHAVRRSMTAPSVGVLVALAFVSIIDAPERFPTASLQRGDLPWSDPKAISVGQNRPERSNHPVRRLLPTYLFEAAGIY